MSYPQLSEFFANGGVIVDLCASWCAPCQQFYASIYPSIVGKERIHPLLLEGSSQGSASTRADAEAWSLAWDLDVVLHVDAEPTTKGQIIAAVEPHLPTGVSEVAFPTFVFIDSSGNIVGTVVGLPDSQLTEWNALLAQAIDLPPEANAGSDRVIELGSNVTLNGSASSDPAGQALTFGWTVDLAPGGSSAALSDASAESPAFTPDVIGDYRFQLTVANPGGTQSAPDLVSVTVLQALPSSPLPDVSTRLGDSLSLSELFAEGGAIIDVCAFWCNPCRNFYQFIHSSMPGHDRIHTLLLEGRQQGSTSTQRDASDWAAAYGLDPVLHANGDPALKAQIVAAIEPHLPGGATGVAFPTFVFIDSNGDIVGTIVGLPDSQLAQWNQYLSLLDAGAPAVPLSSWTSVVVSLALCALALATLRSRGQAGA